LPALIAAVAWTAVVSVLMYRGFEQGALSETQTAAT
jgi:hypothetical protein